MDVSKIDQNWLILAAGIAALAWANWGVIGAKFKGLFDLLKGKATPKPTDDHADCLRQLIEIRETLVAHKHDEAAEFTAFAIASLLDIEIDKGGDE